ncbi:hypothetical protein [Amorphus sp. 3PC139-8]|uniref:hypothetical protein n=1 Tax=Amorphus sp. 3PC139-8 TaxID=2735676 RepID=UPI00345C7886
MTQKISEERAEALLEAIVARSPYRRGLQPHLVDITRIALANAQLRTALCAIAARSRVATTGVVTKRELGAEGATLHAFLEHVFFASPGFLSTVGEWPIKGAPDGL